MVRLPLVNGPNLSRRDVLTAGISFLFGCLTYAQWQKIVEGIEHLNKRFDDLEARDQRARESSTNSQSTRPRDPHD
jgi:hypothetical protein